MLEKVKKELLDKKYKPLIYVVLLLIIVNFSIFIPTNSKYILNEDPAISPSLIYRNGLYELHNNEIIKGELYEGSNYDTIFVHYRFSRNEYGVGYKDVYSINLPSVCNIESINYKGDRTNPTDVVYEKDDPMDYMDAIVSCPVESVINPETGMIQIAITVNENINDEGEITYRYGAYNSILTLEEYRKRYPKEDIDPSIIVLNETDDFSQLVRELQSRLDFPEEDYIPNFLEKYKNNLPDIPGLEFLNNEKPYKLKIMDSFKGYIMTYKKYILEGTLNNMYFTSDQIIEIDKAFNYYLKEYYKVKTDITVEDIITYVNSFSDDGIAYVTVHGNTIYGFSYSEDGTLTIAKEVEDFAHNFINKELRVSSNNILGTLRVLRDSITLTNEDIEYSLASSIASTVRTSLQKNVEGVEPKTSFTDYYVVNDQTNNRKILIKVFSKGDIYTYTELTKLDFDNNLTIALTNSDTQVTVKISMPISNESRQKVEEALNILKEYFKTEVDSNLINDLDGLTQIEFIVNK